jgi:hypothetical protein
MKDDAPKAGAVAPPDAEPFLARWSRRKVQARQHGDVPPAPPGNPAAEAAPGDDDVPSAAEAAPGDDAATGDDAGAGAAPRAGAVLPDLESLDADSDYSAFMAQGVDESLRREALRKLFRSPKFNVPDGLDDYCDDFTRWEGLGDIITADMRHQMERAAKLAREALDKLEGEPQAPEKVASLPDVPPAADDVPGDGTEEHERKERPA